MSKPNKRMQSYIRMGIKPGMAYAWSRSRIASPVKTGGGWAQACSPIMKTTVTTQRLKHKGYLAFAEYFQRFLSFASIKARFYNCRLIYIY